MKYRRLDENGDYVFGQGDGNFYKDQPEAVAQAIDTRLRLIEGEWFLDKYAGTQYNSKILGAGTINSYDLAIQQRIIGTPGFQQMTDYKSGVDQNTRNAQVICTIDTLYGPATVQTVL